MICPWKIDVFPHLCWVTGGYMLVCFAQNIPNMLLVLVCQDVDRGLYHQLVSCSNVPSLKMLQAKILS